MSHRNQPPTDALLLEAVELRIGGCRWEVVAEKVKRSINTVRRWPLRYPERWQEAIERAEQRLTVDSNAESVVVLRNMLRADDIKMRWQAAKTLVGMRVELGKLALRFLTFRTSAGLTNEKPNEDPDFQFFRFLRQHSDEELQQVLDAVEASEARDRPGHAAANGCELHEMTCGSDTPAHDQPGHAPASETP
jgi:transposase